MEEYWEKKARESKEKKELQKKYPLLDKKVRRKGRSKWEEGVVVLEETELYIKYSEDDFEQLFGLPFQIWNDVSETWIEG